MPRPASHARILWLFAGALQFALPGLASLADARLHAEEARVRSHVESEGTKGCPRVHPQDCGLCRTIAATAQLGRFAIFIAQRSSSVSAPTAAAATGRKVQRGLPQPRAPPTLS